jgi:hypothetical protein
MTKRSTVRKIDRERLKASWRDIHPGVPSATRLDLCLEALVDALVDEIEGK